MNRKRIAIWVESLLGYGHALRALALAAAFPHCNRLVLSGSIRGNAFLEAQLGECRLAPLPTVRLEHPTGALLPPPGCDLRTLLKKRLSVGWRALRQLKPDVVIIEHFPFGRWGFEYEISELLVRLREHFSGCQCIASVRDIPQGDDRIADYGRVVRSLLELSFDQVIVHGERALTDLDTLLPELTGIGLPVDYTGYLGTNDAPAYDPDGPVVLDFGGGWNSTGVAHQLLDGLSAVEPRRHVVVVAGRRGAGQRNRYSKLVKERSNVTVMVDRPKRNSRAGTASMYITRAGYNAAAGVLAGNVPTIMVPHEFSGEQRLRAQILARAGRSSMLREAHISKELLTEGLIEARQFSSAWQPIRRSITWLRSSVLP